MAPLERKLLWGRFMFTGYNAVMSMPRRLVFVRHGESEGNAVYARGKLGDDSGYTPDFKARLSSNYRLSKKGRWEAEQAGEWLKQQHMDKFDRYYVSTYARALETAGLMNLKDAVWYVEDRLREREHGDLDGLTKMEQKEQYARALERLKADSFHGIPPNGESIAQLTDRLRILLDTLHRECSDGSVIVVCHGEVMWAYLQMIERMPIARWLELDNSNAPHHRINNCQIIEYSRENPETGELSARLDWVRWVCPWDLTRSSNTWQKIERPRYSNEQLLELVEEFPNLPEL